MQRFYYLSSCDTCKRIIKSLDLPETVSCIDIKKAPLKEEDLAVLYAHTQSYEALLNKRAQKLKAIDKSSLTETRIKELLLSHYTFLKRPVLLLDDQLFVGNAKATVEAAKAALHG